VVRLRTQGSCFQPAEESLNDHVVDARRRDVPDGTPVGEGGNATRHPLIVGNGSDQRSPIRMSCGGPLPHWIYHAYESERTAKSTQQIAPCFVTYPVSGWPNLGHHGSYGAGLGG